MGAIGLHIQQVLDTNRLFRCLDRWSPDDIILVGQANSFRRDIIERYPRMRIWRRFHPDDDSALHKTASQYIHDVVIPMAGEPFHLAADNEPWFTKEKVYWWRDVVRACTDYGVRVAIPGFSVGGPQTPSYDLTLKQIIGEALPLIQALEAGNHVLRLNEYWGVFPTSGWSWTDEWGFRGPSTYLNEPKNHEQAWHCGRWKHWQRQLGPWLERPINILIGEHGPDTVDGDPAMKEFASWVNGGQIQYSRGVRKWHPRACENIWRNHYPGMSADEIYGRMLVSAARWYYEDEQVLGQCVFLYSEQKEDWWGFDISEREELWNIVGDYNRALREPNVGQVSVQERTKERTINIQRKDKEMPKDRYSFWWHKGAEWDRDHGNYSNDMSGVAQAIEDLFGRGNQLWIKLADGARYMGEFKYTPEQFAIRSVQDATDQVMTLSEHGTLTRFWCVPLGLDNWKQEVKILTNVMAGVGPVRALGIILDIEPYDRFWGHGRPEGLASQWVSELKQGLLPGQQIWLSADTRANKLAEIRWREWEPYVDHLQAQTYWNIFKMGVQPSIEMCVTGMHKVVNDGTPLGISLPWFDPYPDGYELQQAINSCTADGYPYSFFKIDGYTKLAKLAEILKG